MKNYLNFVLIGLMGIGAAYYIREQDYKIEELQSRLSQVEIVYAPRLEKIDQLSEQYASLDKTAGELRIVLETFVYKTVGDFLNKHKVDLTPRVDDLSKRVKTLERNVYSILNPPFDDSIKIDTPIFRPSKRR